MTKDAEYYIDNCPSTKVQIIECEETKKSRKRNIILGFLVGFLGIYLLAYFVPFLMAFVFWDASIIQWMLEDLKFMGVPRMALLFGVISAIVGGTL